MKHFNPQALETKEENDDADPVRAAVEELTSQFGAFRTKQDDRLREMEEKHLTKLGERLDKMEARLNRPGAGGDNREDNAEIKAFEHLIRKGEVLDTKALNASNAAQGGVLAPGDYETEIIKNIVLFSPVRSAARVSSMSAGTVSIPRRTGVVTGAWVGETEQRTATEPTYGMIDVMPYEMACYVDVSQTLLEDSAFDLQAELSTDIGEEFGRMEGAAFIAGDGLNKPLGILNTTGIEVVKTGAPSGFPSSAPADVLIDLVHSLPTVYANRGAWMMNRATMGIVRKFKDEDGRYLWQPPLSQDLPPTLLGRPVIEAPDMPDVAADETPIIFGDFMSGFRVFDRIGLSILRDGYTQATRGIIRIHARRRVTGMVMKTEALKKLKVAS